MVRIGLGQIMVFGGVLAAGGLGYHLLESGAFSSLAQLGQPAATNSQPGPGVVTGSGPCPGPFVQLSTLVAQNPQIVGLMQSWQHVDAAHSDIPGAGPYNWQAFRAYITRLGYADPGGRAPQSFCPPY